MNDSEYSHMVEEVHRDPFGRDLLDHPDGLTPYCAVRIGQKALGRLQFHQRFLVGHNHFGSVCLPHAHVVENLTYFELLL